MKNIILLSILFSLSGCASIQQKQAEERSRQVREEISSIESWCKSQHDGNAAIDPIRDKVPSNFLEATIPQRTNKNKPTEAEREAIAALDATVLECQKKLNEAYVRTGMPAAMYSLRQKSQGESRDRRAALWSGAITYGEFLTLSDQSFRKYQAENSAIVATLNQQSANQRNQQAQADAATNTAIAAQLQSSAAIMNASRPVYVAPPAPTMMQTNCQQYGNRTNCTTW